MTSLPQPASRSVLLGLLLYGALPLAAPAPQQKPEPPPAGDVDWPAPYAFIHAEDWDSAAQQVATLPYDRIELERTTCFGSCPAVTVTFHRDGRATFVGREWAEREGRFSGEISTLEFGRLCFLLDRLGFTKWQPKYVREASDHAHAILRVWLVGASEPVIVDDYGDYGPIELWATQAVLDSVASQHVRWTREASADDDSKRHHRHSIQPAGVVPDSKTAIAIAMAVWAPVFDPADIAAQTPYSAELSPEGVWTVQGSKHGEDKSGNTVFVAEIAKDDGSVIRISHGP